MTPSRPRAGLGLVVPSLLVTLLGLAVLMPPAAAALPATVAEASGLSWPGMKRCGTFRSGPHRVQVYASERRRLSCRKASRIVKALWGPRRGVVMRNSGMTLRRFPGWKCHPAASGGSCERRGFSAGYRVRTA